jgi:hypothetical protein
MWARARWARAGGEGDDGGVGGGDGCGCGGDDGGGGDDRGGGGGDSGHTALGRMPVQIATAKQR